MVTPENVAEFQTAVAAIKKDIDILTKRTERYPIELEACGYCFLVRNRVDIEKLIDSLSAEIAEYGEKSHEIQKH